eukprot:scaffold92396_cov50-Prasinocladus_malaysianus.AAC.1
MSDLPRFTVEYHIVAPDEKAARAKARGICIEQTVEVPEKIVAGTWLEEQVVGRIEKLELRSSTTSVWSVKISYPEAAAGEELPQFLNVLFGLTCQHAEVQLITPGMEKWLPGPRFGVEGLRKLCGVASGPLLCTALKPMGRSTAELADMAYSFAKGGVDIIKAGD